MCSHPTPASNSVTLGSCVPPRSTVAWGSHNGLAAAATVARCADTAVRFARAALRILSLMSIAPEPCRGPSGTRQKAPRGYFAAWRLPCAAALDLLRCVNAGRGGSPRSRGFSSAQATVSADRGLVQATAGFGTQHNTAIRNTPI